MLMNQIMSVTLYPDMMVLFLLCKWYLIQLYQRDLKTITETVASFWLFVQMGSLWEVAMFKMGWPPLIMGAL